MSTGIANDILPVGTVRFVAIHYHIFKNAGSTIEYVLQREFGDQCVSLHGPDSSSILTAETVRDYLVAHPDVAAVTSHHFRYPKPVIPNTVIFDICFFRESIDRFLSFYKHVKRATGEDEISEWSRKFGVSEFFERLIEEHPNLVNNPQLVMVANSGEYTRPPSESDLTRAAAIVQDMAFPGVVEAFDMSAVAAEYFLHPAFPRLKLHYVKQNVGPASSLQEFQANLGDTVLNKLRDLNKLDSELVAIARREVERRAKLVPSLNRRIKDFGGRCERLKD